MLKMLFFIVYYTATAQAQSVTNGTGINVTVSDTAPKEQAVAFPCDYAADYSDWGGMFNCMAIDSRLPRVNKYWFRWAKIDCPVHLYEISERDKTKMPDCFMLISKSVAPELAPVSPKPVRTQKHDIKA